MPAAPLASASHLRRGQGGARGSPGPQGPRAVSSAPWGRPCPALPLPQASSPLPRRGPQGGGGEGLLQRLNVLG